MKHRFTPTILAKLAGVCLLFFFMVVIVACGSGASGQGSTGAPVVTLTVSFGQYFGSPTAGLQSVYCGGWATDASTPYSPNGVVNVYGKFTQTENGNPVGVGGATATATIRWPDGSTDSIQVLTTSDGLAVFTVPLQASAINHIVLIQISFVKGNLSCNIPQAAFFTAILATATPHGSVTPSPNGTNTATPSVTPSISPTVSGTPTSSPSPFPTFPVPSPTPTKTPHR